MIYDLHSYGWNSQEQEVISCLGIVCIIKIFFVYFISKVILLSSYEPKLKVEALAGLFKIAFQAVRVCKL
jgi:hypothetical protein